MYKHVHRGDTFTGFHLGFSSRGANATIGELRGGKDYSNNILYRIFHQQGIL